MGQWRHSSHIPYHIYIHIHDSHTHTRIQRRGADCALPPPHITSSPISPIIGHEIHYSICIYTHVHVCAPPTEQTAAAMWLLLLLRRFIESVGHVNKTLCQGNNDCAAQCRWAKYFLCKDTLGTNETAQYECIKPEMDKVSCQFGSKVALLRRPQGGLSLPRPAFMYCCYLSM
eukprot:GHVU01141983.1.p1 GENE.GHVU01141983.1~~GHVU01141983.1.p1  ORF type:complete len:173 (+),score=5.85 GHVU01141983.1:438-956(+)